MWQIISYYTEMFWGKTWGNPVFRILFRLILCSFSQFCGVAEVVIIHKSS
jgi:hypothetical protein